MALTAAASAREILTRLHDVMAKRLPAQSKLNSVVNTIGEVLNSEVCSIYLLREGVLELFATRGLAQEAVHVTKLAMGEGLVGTIAQHVETLNLDEAEMHPRLSPIAPRRGRRRITASPASRSSGASARWACSRSSMPSRAAMTMSRSRRCRPWRWCCPS
jgi:hypothetical protein